MPKQTKDIIKEIREKRGMTQAELAHAAGLVQGAIISQFENGTRHPSFETLVKLSDALKVTTDYLSGKRELGYSDILSDPKMEEMLEGMMDMSEKDKERLYQFFSFLKSRYSQ